MNVLIREEELYPFYDFDSAENCCSNYVVDVDAKTLSRWRRAKKAFEKWQNEMEAALKAAQNKEKLP